MVLRHSAVGFVLALILTGCNEPKARDAANGMFEGTLAEACGEDCLFWSETDNERGVQGTDSLRAYIEPSFGEFSYRFEIVPQPQGCITIWPDEKFAEDQSYCAHYLVRMRKQVSQNGQPRTVSEFEDFRFILPQEDARELLGVADRLAQDWTGDRSFALDGTTIGFELTKRGKTRSMISNGSLHDDHRNPAAWVGAELHRLALAYGPTGQIPRSYDWHSFTDQDGRFACNSRGLNVPDPDGFGTGDDACARLLADQPSR